MNFKNFTIIGLVLMNLALLAFIFFGRSSGHHRPGKNDGKLFDHFQKELCLSDEQVSEMKTLRKANKELAEKNIEKIRALKSQFRELAIAPTFDSTSLNNLVREISDLTFQTDKELVLYIRATRDLLSPDQQAKFDKQFHRFLPNKKSKPNKQE